MATTRERQNVRYWLTEKGLAAVAGSQTTTVTDWSTTPATDREVPIPPRANGRPHLSECLLFSAPNLHCTCDDFSPEWTI